MIATTPRCDPLRLKALLEDQLTHEESETVTEHLDACDTCRRQLVSMAGEDSWWDDAREVLGDSVALSPQSDTAQDASAAGETDAPWIRSLLEPDPAPESLGRIGGYTVQTMIGHGGFGVVLKGADDELCRTVAIKVMHPHVAGGGAARKRFLREAQAAAAVMHPNVVPIYAVRSENKIPFLVMPYIAGGNLQQRIDQEGPLELEEVLRIGIQISEGLAAAHRHGLVHRDIKPANILLEDGSRRVLISDFGLARALDDATLTGSGMVPGTPQFMSPEQAEGKIVDHRSDLFSLGSLLYTLASGRVPFPGDSVFAVLKQVGSRRPRPIQEINEQIPAWFDRVVAELMQPSPDHRPQNAESVASLLQQCLGHLRQPSVNELPRRLQETSLVRRWQLIGTLAVGLVIGIAFAPPLGTGDSNEGSQRQAAAETESITPSAAPKTLAPKNSNVKPRSNESSNQTHGNIPRQPPTLFGQQIPTPDTSNSPSQRRVQNVLEQLSDGLDNEIQSLDRALLILEVSK